MALWIIQRLWEETTPNLTIGDYHKAHAMDNSCWQGQPEQETFHSWNMYCNQKVTLSAPFRTILISYIF